MDVVYPVIKANLNNIELLYSLRSLQKIEHGKVFIVGYKPDWAVNVEHIPFEDNNRLRTINIIHKLKLVIEDKNISEDFIFMNDDIYFNKRLKKINYFYKGDITQHLEARKKFGTPGMTKAISESLEGDDKDFETHFPFVFNKRKLKKMFETYDFQNGNLYKSVYCKMNGIKGSYQKDQKIKHEIPEKLFSFFSSSDNFARSKEFKGFMDGLFPNESLYENNYTDKYEATKNMTKVKLLRPIYPYKSGEIMMMEEKKARYFRNQVEIIEEREAKAGYDGDKKTDNSNSYAKSGNVSKKKINKAILKPKSTKGL